MRNLAIALAAAVLAVCSTPAHPAAPPAVEVATVDAPGATVTVWQMPGSTPGATTAVVWLAEAE